MARDAVFGDGGGLVAAGGVDEGEGVILLVGYEQGSLALREGAGGCEGEGE